MSCNGGELFQAKEMIRHVVLIVTMMLVLLGSANAQQSVVNTTTKSGEWARYEVYYNWGFIWMNAAEVRFSTQQGPSAEPNVITLNCVGRTYDSYDWFFSVRDTFRAEVHSKSLIPYKFRQRNYEGKRRTINDYQYSTADSVVRMNGELWASAKEVEHRYSISRRWNADAVDVLTMVYRARNIDYSKYRAGDKIPIRMIINSEVYDLYIRYLGKETVTTKEGRTFKCLKINPLLVDGTIFSGGEDMTVWVTDDKCRVPVVIEAKVIIGSVKAMYVNGGGFVSSLTAEVRGDKQ